MFRKKFCLRFIKFSVAAADGGRFLHQILRSSAFLYFCVKLKESLKMAFAENHGMIIFDQILSSEGLAHIGENIFEQFDGETLENCESVCELWRQFISNNGVKLWKRQYLHKLAKPGTHAHALIKSNPNLFQFDCQADQGTHFNVCLF
jgi:hypothetical protein